MDMVKQLIFLSLVSLLHQSSAAVEENPLRFIRHDRASTDIGELYSYATYCSGVRSNNFVWGKGHPGLILFMHELGSRGRGVI